MKTRFLIALAWAMLVGFLVGLTSTANAQGPTETKITPVPKSQQVNPTAGNKPVSRAPGGRAFPNGGFENGNYTGWTKSHWLNPGLTLPQPFTGASINRNAGGSDQSIIVGSPTATPRSLTDPTLGANITLRLPFNGRYSARVNGPTVSRTSNEILMSVATTAADVRASTGNIHIFLAYAPVLEDPGHAPEEQPFFYVAVRNVTRNTLLFERFAFAGQGGLPWQSYGAWRYLDWQAVEVIATPAQLTPGETISLTAIGAACSLGAHAGWVYVDEFGTLAPTQTTVTTSPNPSTHGQPVTFTANVALLMGGTLNAGTVQFYADGVAIGTPRPVSGGVATLSGITTLAAGNRTITAVYSGDNDFSSSTSPNHTHVVTQTTSTTTLTSSRNPSIVGAPVTFTCAVSGSGITPTGTVSLYAGTTLLGSGPLSGGQRTFTTSALAVGSHAMRCEYAGDNNYTASTGQMTQQVTSPTWFLGPTRGMAFGNPATFGRLTATGAGAGCWLWVAQYVGNPVPGGGTPSYNFHPDWFYDVRQENCTSVQLSFSGPPSGGRAFWWSGTEWLMASNQSGALIVDITNITSPNLTQLLNGRVFGITNGVPEVPEASTLLLLGGGLGGAATWLRYQWSRRKKAN